MEYNKNTKVLIIGPARFGKDTMAEILEDNFHFTFESSSVAAARIFIYDELKDKYGYETFEECFEDRVNHRPEWYNLICEYNKDDKMRLAKEILKHSDCYVGMRDYFELEEAKDLFDIIVWVDAEKRLPLESQSSMTCTRSQAHVVIDNNTTLEDFKWRVLHFGNLFLKPKNLI